MNISTSHAATPEQTERELGQRMDLALPGLDRQELNGGLRDLIRLVRAGRPRSAGWVARGLASFVARGGRR